MCHRVVSAQTTLFFYMGRKRRRAQSACFPPEKASGGNIYIYIARTLSGLVLKNAKGRERNFLARTFWTNDGALGCNLEDIAVSLMGRNVDRSFWGIGSGASASHCSRKLIDNAVYPRGAFFDCAILYLDAHAGWFSTCICHMGGAGRFCGRDRVYEKYAPRLV